MSKANISWFAFLIYSVIGAFLIALVVGIWMLIVDLRFSWVAISVEAVIVEIDYKSVPNRPASTNSFPTFSFIDQSGTSHEVKVAKGWGSELRRGETVKVLYNPKAPEAKLEAADWRWWKGFGALIVGILGPFFVLVFWKSRTGKSGNNEKRLHRNRLARERRARLKAERAAAKKEGE